MVVEVEVGGGVVWRGGAVESDAGDGLCGAEAVGPAVMIGGEVGRGLV